MSEVSHTPGPWSACGTGNGMHFDIHRKTPTEDGGFFAQVDAMHTTEQARATAAANARLVAAAPDLLVALESLLAHVTIDVGLPEHEITIQKARAALAKAIGDSA